MWRGVLSLVCWLLLWACLMMYAAGCMPFAFPYHRYEGFSIWGGIGLDQGGSQSQDTLGNRSGSRDAGAGWDVNMQINWTAVYREEEEDGPEDSGDAGPDEPGDGTE